MRIRRLLLVLLALLVPAACKSQLPPDAPLVIAVPSWYAPEKVAALAAVADDPTGPAVRFQVMYGKKDAMRQKVMLGARRGDFADAALVRLEWLGPLVDAQVLRPLPPELAAPVAAEALPGLRAACAADGQWWAMPFDADALLVWYRRDLAGDAAPAADNWDRAKFRALAKAMSGERFGFAFAAADYANTGMYFLPWYLSFGGRLTDARGKVRFDAEPAARALAWLVGLKADGLVPPDVAALEQNDVFNGLAGGAHAMTLGGSWERGMLAEQSVTPDAFAALPVPGASSSGCTSLLGGWAFVLLRDAREGAVPLLARFFSAPIQERKLTDDGLLPVRISLLNHPWFSQSPDGPACRPALANGQALPLDPRQTELLERLGTMVAEVFLGKREPDDAARRVADELK